MALGDVPIQIGDLDFKLQGVVAITGPARFAGWGIGGILSAQHLHPRAQVVVDLLDRRLTLVAGAPPDVAAWVAARSPSVHPLSLERAPGDSTILVNVAIDTHDPVVTLLDTGGMRTEFAGSAVPGLRGLRPGSGGRGVGGGQTLGVEVENRTLRVGDATLPVPNLLIREEIGNAPGLIGMDILRGTILVVSTDEGQPVIWFVPTQRHVPRTAAREERHGTV
ncbi:MAG: hypothetical protein M3O93_07095 [Chloroflexota bacterium]|nr:hypothetical protein [Chloroflexota bacterium]